MKRCCECGKLLMPWNTSNISFSPIHRRCHEAILNNREPDERALFRKEIDRFSIETGIKANVRVEP